MENEVKPVADKTTAKKSNKTLLVVLMLIILAGIVAVGGVGAYMLTKDKDDDKSQSDSDKKDKDEDDSDEDTDDNEDSEESLVNDIIEAQEDVESYKITFETETGTAVFALDKNGNSMISVVSNGETINSYTVDGYTYFESLGSWIKYSTGNIPDTEDTRSFEITPEDFEDLEDMIQLDDEDCLGSKNKCYVFTVKGTNETSEFSKVRVDKKTKLVDSFEMGEESAVFEYDDFEIELPDEAQDAIDYDELYKDLDNFDTEDNIEEEDMY